MTKERRRWTREAPDVRVQQLLDAAHELIVDRGYDAMTMADVADAAGVGKGTVYLYFDSKLALLEGLRAGFWASMLVAARTAAGRRARTWRAKVERFFEGIIDYGDREHDFYHSVYSGSVTVDTTPHEELIVLLTELLEGGQQAGEFDMEDPSTSARFLIHAWHGMNVWVLHGPVRERRRRTRQFLALCHRVYATP